jgi:hypothetical protein
MDGPLVVHRAEFLPVADPEVGIRSQVIDVPAAADGRAHRATVADVRPNYLDPIEGKVVHCRPGSFENPNDLPLSQEPFD